MKSANAIALSLLLLTAPLGSCANGQLQPSAPISSVAPAEFNKAKQALIAAHLVHKTTADFLTIAAETNLCKGTCAVEARKLLLQSAAVLSAADAAVATGDAKSIEDKIAQATNLIGQINAVVGH